MEKINLKIEGMACNHCVMTITKALNSLDGVKNVKVSLKEKNATLEYDPKKVKVEDIKNAVEEQGYDVVE